MILTCPTCHLVLASKGVLNSDKPTVLTTTCFKCLKLYTITVTVSPVTKAQSIASLTNG